MTTLPLSPSAPNTDKSKCRVVPKVRPPAPPTSLPPLAPPTLPPLRPRRKVTAPSTTALPTKPQPQQQQNHQQHMRYRCTQLLGTGAFAKVWLAADASSGEQVAVKVISDPAQHAAGQYEYFLSKPLRHANIVRTHGCHKTAAGELLLVQEYCAGGELFAKIEPDVGLPVADAREHFHSLLAAIGYMHDHGLVHRDVKPENVLLDRHGMAKLCDFGLSEHEGQFVAQGNGTLPYAPPEVLAHKGGYTVHRAQDMWSLGVVLYVMLAGDFPWLEASPRDPEYRAFAAGDRTHGAWRTFSAPLLSLFDRLLAADPARRCSVDEAQPYLASLWIPRRESLQALARCRHRFLARAPSTLSAGAASAASLSAASDAAAFSDA